MQDLCRPSLSLMATASGLTYKPRHACLDCPQCTHQWYEGRGAKGFGSTKEVQYPAQAHTVKKNPDFSATTTCSKSNSAQPLELYYILLKVSFKASTSGCLVPFGETLEGGIQQSFPSLNGGMAPRRTHTSAESLGTVVRC